MTLLSTLLVVSLVAVASTAAIAKDKTKDSCKNGGWQGLTDESGDPFTSKKDCTSFAQAGGTPMETIAAIAYSDLNGNHIFDAGDVMISQVVDTDGNGADAGDRIEMGQYPTKLEPTAADFVAWGVTSHNVSSASYFRSQLGVSLTVQTPAGTHRYTDAYGESDVYHEETAPNTNRSAIVDTEIDYQSEDQLFIRTGSPSQPPTPVDLYTFSGPVDSRFIDVEIE